MKTYRMSSTASLLLCDLRDPAQSVQAISVQLPVTMINSIDRTASELRTSSDTLVFLLLAHGMEQLETIAVEQDSSVTIAKSKPDLQLIADKLHLIINRLGRMILADLAYKALVNWLNAND